MEDRSTVVAILWSGVVVFTSKFLSVFKWF